MMYIYATQNKMYSFTDKNELDAFEMSIESYEKNKGNKWVKGEDYGVFEASEFDNSYMAFLDYVNSTLKI